MNNCSLGAGLKFKRESDFLPNSYKKDLIHIENAEPEFIPNSELPTVIVNAALLLRSGGGGRIIVKMYIKNEHHCKV
jgi:hypothetical protein